MPMAKKSSAMARVRPKPPAAFSPLAITKSSLSLWRSAGSSAWTTSRPGLPIMSPIKSRFMKGGSSKFPDALFGKDHVQAPIMGLARKRGGFLTGIGDADGRNIQQGDGAIIEAAAIAQPGAGGIKRQQRHQQQGGNGARPDV